ncbi:FGGY-family carbohydrate kinase [Chitinophaga japonensis]|uniref:Autoinducer 2 (AI-2) kinase n=1 Tax=Chitinophaga japonensis TaxID=104662 RepID=A0A562TC46_CHIJA|nr:FGGY family carbohydrate kinase [Chitinophaga japonensis]TWI90953.1 autoinducer 2 (AI-2) kinase [Chitinophaga japonensis]
MTIQGAYIIVDIGTGNVRVAAASPEGKVLGVAREDIQYEKDPLYPDALQFNPDQLWQQVLRLAAQVLEQVPGAAVKAITATSQREGIVLLSADGRSLAGLPNIDHRGREWESMIPDKSEVYRMTGRYPTSLFSALKLVGIRERKPGLWQNCSTFLSISNWVEYKFSGLARYEHSQASETLLYDVAQRQWSPALCRVFGLDPALLPELAASATVLGNILPEVAQQLGVPAGVKIVVGGGDTQLAIKSTRPAVEDMVIVSGTTTPIVKLTGDYTLDEEERTWTSRDIENGRFIFEANAGVTGLNYQRLKEIFYPNEDYAVIEKELAENTHTFCMASLGSLLADEEVSLTRGGFIFPAPVSHLLTRGSFVWATMLDIACSIVKNYRILAEVAGHRPDYIWGCGGGLQSRTLRQLIANLTGKKVQLRSGYQQSSAIGGALICNEALQVEAQMDDRIEAVCPQETAHYAGLYAEWEKTRSYFRNMN